MLGVLGEVTEVVEPEAWLDSGPVISVEPRSDVLVVLPPHPPATMESPSPRTRSRAIRPSAAGFLTVEVCFM